MPLPQIPSSQTGSLVTTTETLGNMSRYASNYPARLPQPNANQPGQPKLQITDNPNRSNLPLPQAQNSQNRPPFQPTFNNANRQPQPYPYRPAYGQSNQGPGYGNSQNRYQQPSQKAFHGEEVRESLDDEYDRSMGSYQYHAAEDQPLERDEFSQDSGSHEYESTHEDQEYSIDNGTVLDT